MLSARGNESRSSSKNPQQHLVVREVVYDFQMKREKWSLGGKCMVGDDGRELAARAAPVLLNPPKTVVKMSVRGGIKQHSGIARLRLVI